MENPSCRGNFQHWNLRVWLLVFPCFSHIFPVFSHDCPMISHIFLGISSIFFLRLGHPFLREPWGLCRPENGRRRSHRPAKIGENERFWGWHRKAPLSKSLSHYIPMIYPIWRPETGTTELPEDSAGKSWILSDQVVCKKQIQWYNWQATVPKKL